MLLVHETHAVVGAEEDRFEERFREGWAPAIATDDDARLLFFLHHAHGTGPAYQVVTITALSGAAAWERLAARVAPGGDLHEWAQEVDGLRHSLNAKVLRPAPFSPLTTLDLSTVPIEGDHEPALFMEDTAWPHRGRFDAYLAKAGTLYVETLRRAEEVGRSLLRLEGAFIPAFGTGVGREVVLWQRVVRPEGLVGLLGREVPPEYKGPGTWMHDALEVRDRWESRILRTARWSPLG